MLIVESMDADSETRRISPIALHGGDLGTGPYTDLLNGPMDHGAFIYIVPLCSIVCSGWCTHYTCLKRLSTFYTIVALGTEYHLWFTGSNPGHFRFHLLNAIEGTSDHPGEGIKLSIWYKNPRRKDVYKVLAADSLHSVHSYLCVYAGRHLFRAREFCRARQGSHKCREIPICSQTRFQS